MRGFFLLLLLAGAALGIFYPWYANNFSGEELGSWPVYDRASGFKPFEADLGSSDAPVRVLVDLTTLGAPAFENVRAVLTMTVSHDGRTVLAKAMSFADSVSRQRSPQSQDRIYRAEAGVIDPVAPGTYKFTVGQGDVDDMDMRAVEVELRSGAAPLDRRAQPAGFALMAVGFIGLVVARRRRRGDPPANPNSQPPPPRWGRGASRN